MIINTQSSIPQSDWNQTNNNSPDFIKNKPTIPDISGKADKATTLAGYGITDASINNGTITLGNNSITPITEHQSLSGYVPTSRTINSKALSSDITLSASDVGAASSSHTHNYAGSSSAGGSANSVDRATFGDSSNGEHNANSIASNGMWYYTSNGPTTTIGASTTDGALYSQAYNTSWVGQIAQDYRNGNLFIRGKNNGSWTNWKAISDLIGCIFWWSGTLATIPSNAKVCNGQTLSSSTYATLYARIGTTYGGNSTNFALPDLRIGTSTSNGRFIRACFTDSSRNAKQDDAIRNITGKTGPDNLFLTAYSATPSSTGAIYANKPSTQADWEGKSLGGGYSHQILFNANRDDANNLMAGHANGDDIHPYNISMIPIIIVS